MSVIWRAFTTLLVVVALAATAWGLFRAVEANETGSMLSAADATGTTADVRVNGFGDPQGFTVSHLSGAARPATVNAGGAAPGLIKAHASTQLLALTRPTGELVGLAWLNPDELRSAIDSQDGITLSPQSTARSLVALAPGVLDSDNTITGLRVTEVENTTAFDALVGEVARVQDLRVANDRLEQALAAVLDLVPTVTIGEQGCDAAAGSVSQTAAGTCVIALRTGDTAQILNNQFRWVGVFAADAQQVCAVIPPRPANVEFAVPGQCPLAVDLAAPGPTADNAGPNAEHQIRVATLVNTFGQFGAPFAELVLGAPSSPQITAEQVTTWFVPLVLDNPQVAGHLDALGTPSIPVGEQSSAFLASVRAALAAPGLSDSVFGTDYFPNAEGAALLSLYERTLTNRSAGVGPTFFTAPGWERVELSAMFDRAGG